MATSIQGERMNSAAVVAQSLQLRLMVDKRKKRVVYAECDRFMADALFSFLVTPVGALVRRTGKDSDLGCMDSLYKSVENMDLHHFQTPACRELLLRPRSAFGFPHHRLKIPINDVEAMTYACVYCPRDSVLAGTKCKCGREMTRLVPLNFPSPPTSDVVFVRKDLNLFVLTDDLFLAPSSDPLKHELCTLAGVEHSSTFLEERVVPVDNVKIVELMKLSLHSNTPLTEAFSPSDFGTKPMNWPLQFLHKHLTLKKNKENLYVGMVKKLGKNTFKMLTQKLGMRMAPISITIFHNQKRVVFAKVGKDFIDLICSFLTFPLGSIVKAAAGGWSFGCLDNLHQVAKKFRRDSYFYERKLDPKYYGKFILSPTVAPHHNGTQQLKIGRRPFPIYRTTCPSCINNDANYLCRDIQHNLLRWKTINPKCKGKPTTKAGGGYIRWPEIFLITNAFVIQPILNGLPENDFGSDLETKFVNICQEQALKLLMASLFSKDPLTDVFLDTY